MKRWSKVAGRGAGIGVAVVGLLLAALACSRSEKSNAQRAPGVAAAAAPVAGKPTGKRGLLFIGTSLTAGLGLDPDSAFPQIIQRKADSAGLRYEVTNAGVSGETTAALLSRLDWLLRGDFAVIVLETGANDGLRGLPVDQTKHNIQRAIDMITAERPAARLALVQMEAPPNMGRDYTTAFHAMFPALAKANGVQLLPFLLDGVAGRAELNQADGIHPNLRGEKIVADDLWRVLQPTLREVEENLDRAGGEAVR